MTDIAAAPGAVWAFEEHEHRDLARGIDRIHELACGTTGVVTPDLGFRIADILDWLDHELDAHIAWEESWLYPQIDARTGTPYATRSARFDHRQIRDMTARLQHDRELFHRDRGPAWLVDLRCHLFGLEALLRAHIDREERYLIPLLMDDAGAPAAGPATGSAGDERGSGRAR